MSDSPVVPVAHPVARTKYPRAIAALCAMVLALFALSGCGSFDIQGAWQSVGSGTWGQVVGKGATVTFNKTTCSLFSPRDTYLLEKNSDGTYTLTVTGLLGMGGTFKVTTEGNDHMTLKSGDITLELKRIG